jgi:2-amino-4-hydroxy-6-hydroxymethyldihydropteridine diphosphokinase
MSGNFIVGLGSNLGSREAHLCAAVELLRATPEVSVGKLSSVYETEPIGGAPQPHYLNAAVAIETACEPREVLAIAQRIEALLGRERGERWAARTMDLDILWAQGGGLRTRDLIVPHPRLRQRAFALAPLLEVAPELEPVYGFCLQALGGPPRAKGVLGIEPECRVSDDGEHRWVEVTANDRADGLAFAASAFASAIGQSGGAKPTQTRLIQGRCAVGRECESFILGLTAELEAGFRVSRAVISTLEPGRICGRLLGQAGPPGKKPLFQLKVTESITEARAMICWNAS